MEQYRLSLIFWETTQKCNLACSHCRMETAEALNELDTEQAKYLVDSIAEFATPILVLSGGEPLERPDIFEIATYAQKNNIKTAMATNGTLIDDKTAFKIKKSGIRRVSISIDSPEANKHDKFRNTQGAFLAAMNGLNILVNNKISTQINVTLTKSNIKQLENMIKLSIENKADAIHLFLVVPVGCGKYIDEEEKLSPSEYEAVLKKIFDLSKRYKDEIFIKVTCAPQYYRILMNEAPQEFEKNARGMQRISKGCLAGTGVCFISSTGEVYPCGYLPVSAGNILKTDLKDIWKNSETFQRLRNTDNLEDNCRICNYNSVCGGCRARAYFSSDGNYMASDINCILNG
ncbi:MAG: radical SAM protein [Cyanobacteriota bacterium]